MRILVVGGFGSGVGKTTLICRLLEALPGWAAIKVSPVHGASRSHGARHVDHGLVGPFSIEAEEHAGPHSDTARFRAAGAPGVLWVRSRPGRLGEALSEGLSALSAVPGVIVEGNSAARHLEAARVALVARSGRRDFKASAVALAGRADWVVLNRPAAEGLPDDEPRRMEARLGKPVSFVVDAARSSNTGTAAFLSAVRAWARR